jgi:hypothetical protein
MATRHATRFAGSGFPLLLREHGETITYFKNGGSVCRSIMAIVERDVAVPSETGDQVAQAIIVRVLDNATSGISALEIDDGRDKVSLPLRIGDSPQQRNITRRMDDANGVVRFMVR